MRVALLRPGYLAQLVLAVLSPGTAGIGGWLCSGRVQWANVGLALLSIITAGTGGAWRCSGWVQQAQVRAGFAQASTAGTGGTGPAQAGYSGHRGRGPAQVGYSMHKWRWLCSGQRAQVWVALLRLGPQAQVGGGSARPGPPVVYRCLTTWSRVVTGL